MAVMVAWVRVAEEMVRSDHALEAWMVPENRSRPLVLRPAEGRPAAAFTCVGYANSGLSSLSLYRVFKKASPNGKVSL